MALDTRQKRQSALNVGCPWRGPLVHAGESSSAAKRIAALFLYSGLAAVAAASSIFAKHSGSWQVATPYVKRSGSWVLPSAVYARHSGTWQQVY